MAGDRKPGPPPGPPSTAPAGPGGAAPAPRRRTPLPSLAELGAFDGAPPPPKPRLTGRLGEADLKGKPEEPLARPKEGRSWHADTPFETVKTAEGVLLKREAEAKEAAARAAAQPAPPPQAVASPAAPPVAAAPSTASARVVAGVAISWSDLQVAADAGWIDPDAAHALWARWLARKPLTHVEDDASPMPPRRLGGSPAEAGTAGAAAAAPGAAAAAASAADGFGAPPSSPGEAPPVAQGPTHTPAAAESAEAIAEAAQAQGLSGAGLSEGPAAQRIAETAAQPGDEPPAAAGAAGAAPGPSAAWPEDTDSSPEAAASPAAPEREPRSAPAPEPEVLMPSHEYEAHRAAERAFNRPTVEITEVLEVPSLNPVRPPAPSWVAGQFGLALLAAVAAALLIGLGSTLFGAWGACVAAAGCAVLGWRRTAAFNTQGQGLRALLAAHLTIALTAVAVWQLQVAMGWWPQARPMDLFTDTVSRPSVPALQLDWRWLSLAGLTLAVAMVWLIRLRRPAMLVSVTALAWAVAFQVVAGVLQSLGLSMQLMDGFMPMLGAMTLAAAVYMDLVSRRADVADYARWPYLLAAVLLAVGWLSAAMMPLPVQVLRAVALLAFLALAMSLQRPGMMAIALAAVAFEAAWAIGRALGSPWIGGVAWLAGLALTGALMAFVAPRLPNWSRPLQFWMPAEWRRTLRIQRREGTQHTVLKGRKAPPAEKR